MFGLGGGEFKSKTITGGVEQSAVILASFKDEVVHSKLTLGPGGKGKEK